mgnify:CR=1 FL=1
MNILFVAVGSLKSQNGYIVRISEEAKLIDEKKAYLCMFVPRKEYLNYCQGVKFPVIGLFSGIFESIHIFPTYSSFYFHWIKKWHLKKMISQNNIGYVHAESTASGFILAKSKFNVGYTLDLHGFSEYETKLRSTIKNRGWVHKKLAVLRSQRLDRVSIGMANEIIAVSNTMKLHLVEKYNIDSSKISVTPCLASDATLIDHIDDWKSHRNLVRKELGISSTTTVFGYIGGLGTYQMVEEMLDFFHTYNRINKNSVFVMIVIGDVTELTELIDVKQMVEIVKIYKEIPHEDIGKYLCAMDFGLLFRKSDPVNYYASPTKFGEYLSGGMTVIASLYIGDLGDYIAQNSLGFGIDEDLTLNLDLCKQIENVMMDRQSNAQHNIEWVSNEYTWGIGSIKLPFGDK